MKCSTTGCEGRVEANMSLGLHLDDDGEWSLRYVGDEAAEITCDDNGHDNHTPELHATMTAFIDEALPGITWNTCVPRTEVAP